jgi:putative salt-induced outer membrane protein
MPARRQLLKMPRAFACALATAIAALTATPGHAQTTTVPKPDGEWRGALGVGATITSGNTDSVTYAVNGDAIRQTTYNKTSGYLQAVNGSREEGDVTVRTANQARFGAAYTHDNRSSNDRIFGFGSADFDRNLLIDLRMRSVLATGIGYHVLRSEDHSFDVSTGPAYNRERYTSETREVMEWLLAEESTHAITSMVSLKQKLSAYANLNEDSQYRALFDAGMVFKVNNRWSVTMTLNIRYQSNPLPGTETTDTLFVTGLQYSFNP